MSTPFDDKPAPATMLACRLNAPGEPFTVDECPIPSPGEDEVVVRVSAAGFCGSDVHMWRGTVPVRQLPLTLGHEIAGLIENPGGAAAGWKAGDRVIVRAASGCGNCAPCRRGRDNLCSRQSVLGVDKDGGFAHYVRAPAANLVALPAGISFETGAILTDAVATPFHALNERGRLEPGESVAVFGCGGLGSHAVQLARLLGAAKVIAVDIRPGALERAKKLGAHETIDPSSVEPHKAIQQLTDGGVDLALECVGRSETIAEAVHSLRPGARAVVVGMGREPITLPPPALFAWHEHALLGSFGSTREDLDRIIELVQSGSLDLSHSISARLPLSEVNRALEMLENGETNTARVVIAPWEEA